MFPKKNLIKSQNSETILPTISRAFSILSKRDRFLSLGVIGIYAILGILDIVAVFVVGAIGSLAVNGVSGNPPGDRILKVLQFLKIESETIQFQVSVLGLIAATILTGKSIASIILSKKTLFFLSFRAATISRKLVIALLRQNISIVKGRSLQETIFALTSGVQSITLNLLGATLLLVADLILIVAFSITLIVVDILVATITLCMFGFSGIMLYLATQRKAHQLGREMTKMDIDSSNTIAEVVWAYKEMAVKDRLDYYAREIGLKRLRLAESVAQLGLLGLLSKYVIEITLVVGGLLIGAIQFLSQPSTRAVAVISIFLITSARVAPAVLRIQTGLMTLKSSIGSAKPTLDLIDEVLGNFAKSTNQQLEPVVLDYSDEEYISFDPSVRITQMTYKFPNSEKPVLAKVNLSIKKGQIVGIVGPSGSGKTTFIDLILGILRPSRGSILVSGIDPQTARSTWPGAIAYVPQESFITEGTIKENVCLGYPADQIPDFRIEELLGIVGLEKLMQLPEGLHSYIGGKGTRLSGGEKQRIGIARALLSKPKLIVMDEATSALDSETEHKLTQNLLRYRGEATLIIVAHRLSTLISADKIIYIGEEEDVAVGTFQELKKKVLSFKKQAELMGL